MKLVIAVIQPYMLDRVTRVLRQRVSRFFVSEVRAFDSAADEPDLCAGVRIEVPVSDAQSNSIADLIAQTVNTGRIGDGLVMIAELPYAIIVDTGRRGAEIFDE